MPLGWWWHLPHGPAAGDTARMEAWTRRCQRSLPARAGGGCELAATVVPGQGWGQLDPGGSGGAGLRGQTFPAVCQAGSKLLALSCWSKPREDGQGREKCGVGLCRVCPAPLSLVSGCPAEPRNPFPVSPSRLLH